jgi:hypothetical protein
LLETVFTPINIYRVYPETRAEMRANAHILCPLRMSDFKQNWKVMKDFNKTSKHQVSHTAAVLELLHAQIWKRDRLGEANSKFLQPFIANVTKME